MLRVSFLLLIAHQPVTPPTYFNVCRLELLETTFNR
jgi:hypothetical protein